MSNVCADQLQHKFHLSHQLLSSKKTIEIPPRKLNSTLNRSEEMFNNDSPRFSSADETLLRKFLPYNGGDDDETDPFASDHFRMYEFKVRRCTRSRSHDWTDCPFAHPGEKARRRDPRKYHYSGTVCADYRRGVCSRGDNCEFAHGVFECWLHPSRYRTEACKDGKNCKRKVCFFAHCPRELRVLPTSRSQSSEVSPGSANASLSKYRNSGGGNHCCMFCHSVTSSPTSTLLSNLPHLSSPPLSPNQSSSPPVSPFKHRSLSGLSSSSRYSDRVDSSYSSQVSAYKDMLKVIMTSFEEMNFNEMNSPLSSTSNRNLPWIDLPLVAEDDQQQFILSPSTPNPIGSRNFFDADSPVAPSSSRSRSFFHGDIPSYGCTGGDNTVNIDNGSCNADPDLGWVNDLLM